GTHLIGLIVRQSEAAADFGSHCGPDFIVLVKTDAVCSAAKSRRFAYVMQQCAKSESRRGMGRQAFEQHQRVHPDVAFGMKLRRLLDAPHPPDLGQHLPKPSRLVEE